MVVERGLCPLHWGHEDSKPMWTTPRCHAECVSLTMRYCIASIAACWDLSPHDACWCVRVFKVEICSTQESDVDPAGLQIVIYSVSLEFHLNTHVLFLAFRWGASVSACITTVRAGGCTAAAPLGKKGGRSATGPTKGNPEFHTGNTALDTASSRLEALKYMSHAGKMKRGHAKTCFGRKAWGRLFILLNKWRTVLHYFLSMK